jgi:hypothetical protein
LSIPPGTSILDFSTFVQINESTKSKARNKVRRLADYLWEWEKPGEKTWTVFYSDEGSMLERKYLESGGHQELKIEFRNEVYRVDFLAMNIKNQMSQVVLNLRRLGSCVWGWSDGFSWRMCDNKNSLFIERQYQTAESAQPLLYGNAIVDPSKSIYYDIDSKSSNPVKRFGVGSAGQLGTGGSSDCNSRNNYP